MDNSLDRAHVLSTVCSDETAVDEQSCECSDETGVDEQSYEVQ